MTTPQAMPPIARVTAPTQEQRVLAAQRAGLTEVILPARNEADLDDVPESCREEMTFHLVDTIDEVLRLALEPA